MAVSGRAPSEAGRIVPLWTCNGRPTSFAERVKVLDFWVSVLQERLHEHSPHLLPPASPLERALYTAILAGVSQLRSGRPSPAHEGALFLADGRYTIQYDIDSVPSGRAAITVLHETCHMILHSFETSPGTEFRKRIRPKSEFEKLCDSRAVQLAVPAEDFVAARGADMGLHTIPRLLKWFPTTESIAYRLAETYAGKAVAGMLQFHPASKSDEQQQLPYEGGGAKASCDYRLTKVAMSPEFRKAHAPLRTDLRVGESALESAAEEPSAAVKRWSDLPGRAELARLVAGVPGSLSTTREKRQESRHPVSLVARRSLALALLSLRSVDGAAMS